MAPAVISSQNLMTMLGILKIALNHARPNMGLNTIGWVDELKEEEEQVFKFL